jgi:ribosomal protein S18 acetylase RimI-like enzyme
MGIKTVEITDDTLKEKYFFEILQKKSVLIGRIVPRVWPQFFGAFNGENCIGFIILRETKDEFKGIRSILNFAFLNEYKDSNVVEEIYHAVEKYLVKNNCEIIVTCLYDSSDREIYKKFGYRELMKQDNLLDDEIDGTIMIKVLNK